MEASCQCENPMIGKGRQGQRHWLKTSHENSDSIISLKDDEVDVIFYGDSITEGWKGTSYGFLNGRKKDNLQVFQSLFTTDGGGKFHGIPMGISGDRVSDKRDRRRPKVDLHINSFVDRRSIVGRGRPTCTA